MGVVLLLAGSFCRTLNTMTPWMHSHADDTPCTPPDKPERCPCVSALMMPFKVVLAIMLIVAAASALHAQPAGNLERLRDCAILLADSVLAPYSKGDTICLEMAPHPASWLVEQSVLGRAHELGLNVLPCAPERNGRIALAITSIGVQYKLVDNIDLLARECRLDVGASLPASRSSGGRIARSFSLASGDTVDVDQTLSIEASGYDFARGTIPPQSGGGFWKKIVEPAVILGASAVIAILLFTVRSQ